MYAEFIKDNALGGDTSPTLRKLNIQAKEVYLGQKGLQKNNISQLWSKTQVDNMKTRIVSGKQSWEVFKMKILHQSWRKKAGLNERSVGCNHEEIY